MPAFDYSHYLLKKQAIAISGRFRVYNPNGQLVLFSQQKMFKLKEDIRVYSDESQTQEVMAILARQIIDFSAAYDVVDSASGQKVGALRRKGWRSILRDEWEVLNTADQVIGLIREDSTFLALFRRFLSNLVPQNYDGFIGQTRVADFRQRFNPFRYEMDIDFSFDVSGMMDKRLGLAAAILLAAIEGRQN